jgi:glycosyltransferase involved in cell wall biosynthesis
VWHVHEIITPKWLAHLLSILAHHFSDKIVVPSSSAARSLAQGWHDATQKVAVVHEGTNLGRFDNAQGGRIRREYNIDADTFLIGLIGRIQYRKGHDVLIEAAYTMKQKGFTDFEVLFVGDIFPGYEWYLRHLKDKVRSLGMDDYVHFCGYRNDIPETVKDVDVVVVPSTLPESFGLVALEAMAGAKPVIATNQGGITEIVEDGVTGYLIPPGDKESLAEYLMQLAADPFKGAHMGQEGRKRVEQQFSIEHYHEAIRAVVSDVLEKNSKTHI